MNVVFAGMKHCGKSTHAKALAAHWKCPFLDTDELLIKHYRSKSGNLLSVREIFKIEGEQKFRELEYELVVKLLSQQSPEQREVIALGGGLPANPAVAPLIKQLGFNVYLQVAPKIIFKRIAAKGLPPFLDPANPYESMLKLYREREVAFLRDADMVISIDQPSPPWEESKIIIAKIEEVLK
jgi:shikimate kinase